VKNKLFALMGLMCLLSTSIITPITSVAEDNSIQETQTGTYTKPKGETNNISSDDSISDKLNTYITSVVSDTIPEGSLNVTETTTEDNEKETEIKSGAPNTKKEIRSALDEHVNVTDFNIIKLDGTNASDVNGIKNGENVGLELNWSVTLPNGETFKDGDTINIKFIGTDNPKNTSINIQASDVESKLFDKKGTEIAVFTVSASKGITITFNGQVEGMTTLSSSLKIPIMGNVRAIETVVKDYMIGNLTKKILFKDTEKGELKNSDLVKFGVNGTNSISWLNIINNTGLVDLGNSLGSEFRPMNNVIFEDQLIEDASLLSVSFALPVPLLQNDSENNGAFSNQSIQYIPIVGMNLVTQNDGEMYEEFKNRLNVLDYGVFKDSKGVETVVANFGDIGNNGLKITDGTKGLLVGDYLQTNYPSIVTDNQKSAYNKIFSDDNVINGQVPRIVVSIRTSYPNYVEEKMNKTNTSKISWELENGNQLNSDSTGQSVTTTPNGSATVEKNSVKLIKYDEETKVLLPNAKFKLQVKNTSSSSWEDYTNGGSVLEATTNDRGEILFTNLPERLYRFVEIEAAPDYDLSSVQYDKEEFDISKGMVEGVIIKASNKKIEEPTESSTTESSTTESSTTESSTTESSTTESSTTESSTTESSTTESSTTESSTTESSTTESSTTESSTTESSTTESSTTESSTTESSTTESSTTESSTTESSTTESSTTESSTTESSTTESSTTESSTTESSTTESSTTESSTTESSTTESSTTESSTTESSTTESSTIEPSTTESSTTESSTTEPSTTESSTTESSTIEPSTTESSTIEPSTIEPSTTESKKSTIVNGNDNNKKELLKYLPKMGESTSWLITAIGIVTILGACIFYIRRKVK
jgi:hypothetical protein